MRSDPEGVLEAGVRAYAIGDLPAAAAFFAENAVFAIYVDQDVLPFAGQVHGRASILETFRTIASAFEVKRYELRSMSVRNEIVRCQVDFAFRHRASGETIDGVMRIVAEVQNGLITRYREYHDQERIRAFMRLCEQSMKPNQR